MGAGPRPPGQRFGAAHSCALAVRRDPLGADGSQDALLCAQHVSLASSLAEGFTDALLISREGFVLEGPTFSIGWVVDGVIETPSLDLGILASITRTVTLEEAAGLGLSVDEGRFSLDRVFEADEVFALSTLKEVTPVDRVGTTTFSAGPVTGKLAAAYRRRVEFETS